MKIFITLFKESILFAFQALRSNKLRTFLSLLGVTVGIFAIISVRTMVTSMELSLKDSFSSLGSDIVFIQKWPMGIEEGETEYAWWKYWQRPSVTLDDLKILKDRLTTAGAIAFASDANRAIEYKSSSIPQAPIFIASHDFEKVYDLKIEQGRYFSPNESKTGRNYTIIGAELKETLFGNEEALGKVIKIAGKKVEIIGVFEKEGESLIGTGFDEVAMIPVNFAKTFVDFRNGDNNDLWVKAKEGVTLDEMKDEIVGKFRSVRRLRPQQEKNFSINEMSMLTGMIEGVFGVMNLVAFIIGLFAILVGGFGIANIMFVSVRERTNIIGIQKSLGAKNSFILFQFLIEAIVLCFTGGAIGLIIIWIGGKLANLALDFDVILTGGNIVLGLGISVVIGLLSGLIPAIIASRLDPVVAIRSK